VQNTPFSGNTTLNVGGRLIDLSTPRIMGILNVTPDSFFDGGQYTTTESTVARADALLAAGADFIDIGGYSTRPGADEVPEAEERRRVVEAVREIRRRYPEALLSVDTFRASVAEAAVAEGAVMINDISGGSLDDAMFDTLARLNVPYVLMHMRGTPATMNTLTSYDDIVTDMITYFHEKLAALREREVKDIIIDPGFGFAKTVSQNFTILANLHKFNILGRPLLAGISRKTMIWKTLQTSPDGALNGTTALNMAALMNGAKILRVHDVAEAREVVRLYIAMQQA
jgi:dihydropteroate synthase